MPSNVNGLAEGSMPNGTDLAPPPPGKKGKQRKLADSSDTSRLLQARISQLEQDAAGEKDQEAEIGMRAAVPRLCPRFLPYLLTPRA